MKNPLILVANGDIPDQDWLKQNIEKGHCSLVGVDGGTNFLLAADLIPDIVLGDFDSLSADHLKLLEDNWVNIFRFEKEKDETDLELALLYAVEQPQWAEATIDVYGAHGGRFDHEIANLMLLTHPKLADRTVRFIAPHQTSLIVRKTAEIHGRAGDTVSLIPLKGDAIIKNTEQLKWPLIDSTLKFGPARGVSNEMTASVAKVEVADGMVLCVHSESSWKR